MITPTPSSLDLAGKNVAVTGAAGGIGRAIAEMFKGGGANVFISDLADPAGTAREIGAQSMACDVSNEADVNAFIDAAERSFGPLDVYVSNAGVGYSDYPVGHAAGASNQQWETSWQVNVMASVYAARRLLPGWQKRGSGRFIIVASAAGLLNQIGSASYSATKHAALGFAENMAISHWDEGLRVHAICPQYVRTDMTKDMKFAQSQGDLKEPSDVAAALLRSMGKDEFLVLSHAEVGDYFKAKANDYQRYIAGMNRLKTAVSPEDLSM